MSTEPVLELICIGDELLLGETEDANASWLGRRLAQEGIAVGRTTTVGDNERAIMDALRSALSRSGIVLCTGGLGPTADDVTRPAAARLYGRRMHPDAGWLDELQRRYASRGIAMPQSNRVQADLPEGATLLPNPRGTAPGIVLDGEPGMTVLLPGVPAEMRALTEEAVIPLLRQRLRPAAALESRLVRTAGLSEARLSERLKELAAGIAPIRLAYLAHGTGVDLRLTGRGGAAAPALDDAVRQLRELLGASVYADDGRDLAAVVGGMLRDRSLTLAVAESCTGGLVAKRLSDEPGASDFLVAALVTYANGAKRDLLGVRVATLATHGAVSEQCAREMAEGVRKVAGTTIGLSVTGIAGPGGGSEEKPVGTVWIAVADPAATATRLYHFPGDRHEVRERTAQSALDMLRRNLPDAHV